MCLDKIAERLSKPTSIVQDGWKDFSAPDGRLRFPTMSYQGNNKVPMDQWITAEGDQIGTGGTIYPAGFHVYEDEDEAKKIGARHRVYVRKVQTRGMQGSQKVMVAREMYVPSDPSAWPPPDTIASSKGTA